MFHLPNGQPKEPRCTVLTSHTWLMYFYWIIKRKHMPSIGGVGGTLPPTRRFVWGNVNINYDRSKTLSAYIWMWKINRGSAAIFQAHCPTTLRSRQTHPLITPQPLCTYRLLQPLHLIIRTELDFDCTDCAHGRSHRSFCDCCVETHDQQDTVVQRKPTMLLLFWLK